MMFHTQSINILAVLLFTLIFAGNIFCEHISSDIFDLEKKISDYLIAGEKIYDEFDITYTSYGVKLTYITKENSYIYLFVFDLDGKYMIIDLGFSKEKKYVSKIIRDITFSPNDTVVFQLLFSDKRINFGIGDIVEAVYIPIAKSKAKISYMMKVIFPKMHTILLLKIPDGISVETDHGVFSSGIVKLRMKFGIHEFKVFDRSDHFYIMKVLLNEPEKSLAIAPEYEGNKEKRSEKVASLALSTLPYSMVYVNDEFAGYTNEKGYILIRNLNIGKIKLNVRKENFSCNERKLILSEGVNCIEVKMKKLFDILIHSNIAYYRVFVDGKYYGVMNTTDGFLKITEGFHRFRFENFEYYTLNLSKKIQNHDEITLNFEKLPLEGVMDAHFDGRKIIIYITVSKSSKGILIIRDKNYILLKKNINFKPGINKIIWKPRKNGEYTVIVRLGDEFKILQFTEKIKVNTISSPQSYIPYFLITSFISSIIGASIALMISQLN